MTYLSRNNRRPSRTDERSRGRVGVVVAVVVVVIAAIAVGVVVANRKPSTNSSSVTPTSTPGTLPGGAPAPAPPAAGTSVIRGVYVTKDLGQPVQSAVLSASGVDGVLLRYYWNTIEPGSGRFDFSEVDQDIASVAAAGKKFSIGIIVGNYTPSWVAAEGAKTLPFTVAIHNGKGNCRSINVPVPWDTVYLHALDGMISGLANNIKSDATRFDALTQVKVTGIGEYTEETRMPLETPAQATGCALSNAPAIWKANGYRPSLVEQAWNHMIDSYAAAFPDRSLGNDFIGQSFPNIDDSGATSKGAGLALTQKLISDGLARYGARFAVQTQSLRAGTGTTPFVEQAGKQGATIGYQLAEDVYGNPTCAGVQQVNNRTKTSCDPSSIQQALQLGVAQGAAYIELFPRTVQAFETQIQPVHSALIARTG